MGKIWIFLSEICFLGKVFKTQVSRSIISYKYEIFLRFWGAAGVGDGVGAGVPDCWTTLILKPGWAGGGGAGGWWP